MDYKEFAVNAIFGGRLTVAVVNTQTDEVTFLKHENPRVPQGTPVKFTEYVQSILTADRIHPRDVPLFDMLSPLELEDFCLEQKNGVLFSFRRRREDSWEWVCILVNAPEDYSEEKPEILLSLRILSQKEVDEQDDARTVRRSIRKVVKYDFVTGAMQMLKIPKGEQNLRSRYRVTSPEHASWQEEAFVHPDDIADFHRATEREQLLAWFRAGNTEKNVFYRRKMGGLYRWVKLMILPSSDWTPEHPVCLFYIVDVHRSMSALNTDQATQEYSGKENQRSVDLETYYENVINALSFFTQQFKDFYIVDMVNDRYIRYKVDRDVMRGTMPLVGCYSEMAAKIMRDVLQENELEKLICFASLEELRKILADKISVEYSFTARDGKRYRTICTRIESENGVPIKMIARTLPAEEETRMKVKTFGNFEVYDVNGQPVKFTKKKSKQLLAYLVDKYGFPVATLDIVQDVLEKDVDDLNAIKYVSNLYRMANADLAAAGYPGIIIKEWNSLRVDVDKLDCDYYHLMEGDASYWSEYHNEYMKEYSWSEETNAEILHYGGI